MDPVKVLVISTAVLLFTKLIQACSNGSCQLLDRCMEDSDCASGLFCSACDAAGDSVRRCHGSEATNVTAIKPGLPFNKYSWLTTHNSYAIVGEPSYTGSSRVTFMNQEDSVTDQLKNGVRGLMLDMYDFLGDVWLCHSFGSVCYNYTAFEPAINTLKDIEAFLSANPSEIITIFIEDYVHAPKGLTKIFTAAGLMNYLFPVSKMPKDGQDWPTVTKMVASNQRLVVFTSNPSKESTEGIAYQWKYVNENQYGNGGIQAGHCPNRAESAALNSTSRSLIIENFFPDDPVQGEACKYNSNMLKDMLEICYNAAGNRWANFLAVDYYKRSTGWSTFQAVDTLNGERLCGCSDVIVCKLGLQYGVCNSPSSDSKPDNTTHKVTSSFSNGQPSQMHPLSFSTYMSFLLATVFPSML